MGGERSAIIMPVNGRVSLAPISARCMLAPQLIFPPSLTARQRAVLHELGEAHGLSHESLGEGPARHLRLGSAHGRQVGRSVSRATIGRQAWGWQLVDQLIPLFCSSMHGSAAITEGTGTGCTAPAQALPSRPIIECWRKSSEALTKQDWATVLKVK
jgi:hypothetical protein